MNRAPTALDLRLARLCAACPVCRRARTKQRGLCHAIVRTVETHVCPACRAWERVHGRKAHESLRA